MKKIKAQILVVDDTPNWRNYMKTHLEALGGQVYTVATFEQGMEALNQRHYHLAIVDVRLSEGNPNDTSGLLLVKDAWARHIIDRFIVLSAYLVDSQIPNEIPFQIFDKTDITSQQFEDTVKKIIDEARAHDTR